MPGEASLKPHQRRAVCSRGTASAQATLHTHACLLLRHPLPLATLLDEIGLGHLEQLLCGESLSICLLRLSEGRPAFLRYLKDLGVSQLTERQRLANKLGRALREGRVPADLVVTTDQPPCDTEVLEEAMAALDVLCDPVVTEASRQALLLELGPREKRGSRDEIRDSAKRMRMRKTAKRYLTLVAF